MTKNRKASFDSAAIASSLTKDETLDDTVLGLAMLGSGSRSHDGNSEVTKTSGNSSAQIVATLTGTSAIEHLEALGQHSDDAASLNKNKEAPSRKTEVAAAKPDVKTKPEDENSGSGATLSSSNQRMLLEAFLGVAGGSSAGSSIRRDRLESWGGMSDLSFAGIGADSNASGKGGSHAAAALAASALHQTGLYEDVTAAAAGIELAASAPPTGSCGGSVASSHSGLLLEQQTTVPSKISLTSERKYSVASLSDASATSHLQDGKDLKDPEIHAFVAAMATVGDQLTQLAGAVESVASSTGSMASETAKHDINSVRQSSVSDTASNAQTSTQSTTDPSAALTRRRSLSVSSYSKPISVDYDAVAAAVNAAEAATGSIDLASISKMAPPMSRSVARPRNHRPLPLNKNKKSDSSTNCYKSPVTPHGPLHLPPIPQSTLSSQDMEAIRARARAAAGYVPPSGDSSVPMKRDRSASLRRPPLKKRVKRLSPEPDRTPSTSNFRSDVPVVVASSQRTKSVPARNHSSSQQIATPSLAMSSFTPPSTSSRSQTTKQKWDEMFECLVQFVEERKEAELRGATEEEKKHWEWDGNVPTTYKTKDGKALGRWINNQRSAKNKGTLREERESKLVGTGLKWSVLSTNCWSDMLEELKVYVKEKTRDGDKWDGNVPTNYRIKGKSPSDGTEADEDKNLGRWVNRQRCLYQSGKLKKERQTELEKIGLKWSVLSTTSWESMYDALCDYVRKKKEADPKSEWDGNVPANFKTDDIPQKSLGRWVNRQRSAYAKKKLKSEFVGKLDKVGLKWAVHERRSVGRANRITQPPTTTPSDGKKDAENQ